MPRSACSRREEIEDLGLDGDVERGGRLVGDQELRSRGQRHRDHGALAQAARELVRVVARALARRRAPAPGRASPPPAPRPPARVTRRGRAGARDLVADRRRPGSARSSAPGRPWRCGRPARGASASASFSSRSSPWRRTRPRAMRPGGGTSRMIDSAVTLLPQPDSPTSPSTSPRASAKLRPSTARSSPASVVKRVSSASTRSRARGGPPLAASPEGPALRRRVSGMAPATPGAAGRGCRAASLRAD